MTTDSRVKRLKDLMDQIERLPASPDRDHLLRQFRSRAVDIDTGVMPLAIVPLESPASPPRPHVLSRPRRSPRRRHGCRSCPSGPRLRSTITRRALPAVRRTRPRSSAKRTVCGWRSRRTSSHRCLMSGYRLTGRSARGPAVSADDGEQRDSLRGYEARVFRGFVGGLPANFVVGHPASPNARLMRLIASMT